MSTPPSRYLSSLATYVTNHHPNRVIYGVSCLLTQQSLTFGSRVVLSIIPQDFSYLMTLNVVTLAFLISAHPLGGIELNQPSSEPVKVTINF